MAVVNHAGALATAAWDLTADEHHIAGNCTLDAGSTQTLTPGTTPNPIRFDGSFNITTTTSGLITGTGTAALPITWQPKGAASTWDDDNFVRYIYNSGGTGNWVLSYHDVIGCALYWNPSAGTNAVNNIRINYGSFAP